MTRIVVTGYASLDHVILLDGPPSPNRTTTILDRPPDAWPRLGGSPAYVAAALVAGGCRDVAAVSWVGDDPAGDVYRDRLRAAGIDAAGLARVRDARTPVALLSYEPGGGCYCFYDPGMPLVVSLTPAQSRLLGTADWLCLTVGPKAVTDAVLDQLRPGTRLAWVVKHDPRALGPDQAARLAGRADLICHSRGEAAFVREAVAASGGPRPGRILIETRAAEGALVCQDGSASLVPGQPVGPVRDPTGAGDTLAGGVLAALVAGSGAIEATRGGIAAATRLLAGRGRPTEPNDSGRART